MSAFEAFYWVNPLGSEGFQGTFENQYHLFQTSEEIFFVNIDLFLIKKSSLWQIHERLTWKSYQVPQQKKRFSENQ